MARTKRRVALFEVIQKDKRFQRKSARPIPLRPGPLRAIQSWFRNSEVIDPVPRPTPIAPLPNGASSGPTVPDLTLLPRSEPKVETRPMPPESSHSLSYAGPARPTQWQAAYQQLRVWLRPRWQIFSAWIAQQSNILTGAGAALAVIFGIQIARHITQPTKSANAGVVITIEQVRAQPVRSSVLEVAGAGNTRTQMPYQSPETNNVPANEAQPATNSSAPSRQINLNYIVVQTYPDEATADQARDFLMKNGIPCSLEHLPGWRRDWFEVVGMQGFPHTGAPDYAAYRKRIETLSDQFAPRGGIKKFDPHQAIKWLWTN
jgi:hypothetical protein